MQIQVSWFFAHRVLVILWVVASIKSPEALTKNAVQVLCLVDLFIFSHDDYIGLHKMILESCRLPIEAFDNTGMILCKHRGYRVPLGGKFKDGKVVVVLP